MPRRASQSREAPQAKRVAKRQSRIAKTTKEKTRIPARTIIRRPKPARPAFLKSGVRKARRREGLDVMMTNWTEFIKVPLTYLDEEELEELLDREIKSRQRWAIVNRLHSALSLKRTKRERQIYREICLKK